MSYMERYNEWMLSDVIDKEIKAEIMNLSEQEKEMRFGSVLEFGTAGLRGIMGNGTNMMNKYTVAKITEGLGNFLLKKEFSNPTVVIAYDSRHNSKDFAEITALVLNKMNITTYIFNKITPTPVLAYAVLKLEASAGVNITSSHNPKEYNGYKIYNHEGFQMVSPDDEDIMNEINNIKEYQNINLDEIPEMMKKRLFNYVEDDIVDDFVLDTRKLIKRNYMDKNLEIVYTPLHGTGTYTMTEVLNSAGFINLYNVLEQRYPDPDFPTTPYPNPEDLSTFEIAIMVGIKKTADIIISTDTDADRMGIMVRDKTGEYVYLSGNQVGVILGAYILSSNAVENAVIIRTIVTTHMIDRIASDFSVNMEEVYTGTKFIGEKMAIYDRTKERNFIYGFEESIGYIIGTYVRDKNGFSPALVLCDLCEKLKEDNKTLLDYLEELYQKYGYYFDKTISLVFDGIDGPSKMSTIMTDLRENTPDDLGELKIVRKEDYKTGKIYNLINNEVSDMNLLPSNVIRYTLEDGSWCAIRPSGTEPKFKIYIQSTDRNKENSESKLSKIEESILNLINKH